MTVAISRPGASIQAIPKGSPRDGATRHRYRLYGLTLEAGRPLPLLWPEPDSGKATDVLVRFGAMAPPEGPPLTDERGLAIYPCGTGIFRLDGGACFLIPDGNTILADVPPDMGAAELHTCLFGVPMAWLMHLRGRPPLHACVIAVERVAVALAGDSGAGKSTLARALIARGHRLVTDDQAVIDAATTLVHPGYPAMKLWAASAALFGDETPDRWRVWPGIDKFHHPLEQAFDPDPLPLGLVIVLSRDPDAAAPDISVAERKAAAALLYRFIYRVGQRRRLDNGRAGFDWATTLCRSVKVATLRRPDSLAALPAMCEQVECLAGIVSAVLAPRA